MEFDEVLRGRRSIRKFLDMAVEFDLLIEVIDAARQAPSAGNLQGVRYLIIHSRETKEKIAEYCFEQYWMTEAPFFIVVCTQLDKYEDYYGERGKLVYSHMDAAAAIQNLMLKAYDLGLGTCFVGAFDQEKIQELLKIPTDSMVEAIIPIGYPDEKPAQPPKEDLNNIIFFDTYGNKFQNQDAIMKNYAIMREKKLKEKMKKKEEKQIKNSKGKLKEILEKVKKMKLFSDKEIDELEKEYS